ncbi:hypothetical protein [uncultured Clostridium sp.]|uniref:hypothetical protein n=1 Tax=uncultured Clostridium sp. TaxID=59620 RepID=UPI0025D63736|nr:hypothetical protein [uncultured Clostridium sp.]
MGKSSFDYIKRDIKKMYKHKKKHLRGLFDNFNSSDNECCNNNCNYGGRRRPVNFGWLPFFKPGRSPWFYILLCPKMCVVWIILLVLFFCGVSLYGILIIILLGIIFILI